MGDSRNVLRNDERAMFDLRSLYRKFGYSGYKVGKFEEYDLYAHNKSFLVSENVLTFTDTNGKLMALKPDVTLSIVKNVIPSGNTVQKLYYNENVYRTSAESHGFREIMQTGLECIGHIDMLAESEVVMLAARSLCTISEDYVLDISHMGIIEGLMDSEDIAGADRDKISELVKSKNTAGIRKMSESGAVSEGLCECLCTLASSYIRLDESLEMLRKYSVNPKVADAVSELGEISEIMSIYGLSDKLYFDFSVMNDCNYYDGVIFKGFINGIPDSVLSGGRYDRLLKKIGKNCGAVGFAVYLDRLERFGTEETKYDVDVMLVYESDVDKKRVIDAVRRLNDSGKTVKCAAEADASLRYRRLLKIGKGGTETLEAND